MIFAYVICILLLAGLVVEHVGNRKLVQTLEERHADERKHLIAQIQANTQNMPYYPQVGPFPDVPEQKWVHDDSGLIAWPDYGDDELNAELDQVADR